MCGIVGYVGPKQAPPLLIKSLKRLEYRGYDSAGIAYIEDEGIKVYKEKGRITNLEKTLPDEAASSVGICHTRWATHGPPSKINAHPHTDAGADVALVHNGIVDNYLDLKKELADIGCTFTSQTDTETLAHLVSTTYDGDLLKAVLSALEKVEGSFGLGIIHKDHPDELICARNESPLIIGLGINENFIASDVTAVLEYTNKVMYLDNGEVALVKADEVKVFDLQGNPVDKPITEVEWSLEDAEKGGYEHFMLKEIFEQPNAIHEALRGKLEKDELKLDPRVNHIKIIACGTSYHAGITAKYFIERLTKLPVSVEMASEYRYSEPTLDHPLVILITQSGETADTLAAAREAKRRNSYTIAITNVVGSSITREVDNVFYIRAGPEIGVAATKTYSAQLIGLYLIAFRLAKEMRVLNEEEQRLLNQQIRQLPRVVEKVLDDADAIRQVGDLLAVAKSIFFIGRNVNYPTALEGALKLKEISYIHAEGYPAGELKHGPLALLTKETPVVVIAVRDHTYGKILGNIQEVSARNSPVIAVVDEKDQDVASMVDRTIVVPAVPSLFTPVPVTVALQLLAYYVARARACPIDKPRNLAKSVTVE